MAKAKRTPTTNAAGRPKGAATKERDEIDVPLSRCAQCGSTDRAPYTSKEELEHGGIDPQGNEYTHVVWRRTKCLACGQHRTDRSTENRATKARK